MRVVMLCTQHKISDERITNKQAASLANAGHEVLVVGRATQDTVAVKGVKLQAMTLGPCSGFRRRMSIWRQLYRAAVSWKPDVIECHELDSAVIGLLVKMCSGAKVHFDIHELWHETWGLSWPCYLRPLIRTFVLVMLKSVVHSRLPAPAP